MLRFVDQRALADGVIPPEDEDQTGTFFAQGGDDRIGEFLPVKFAVAARRVRPDGQNAVEQQHPRLRPGVERTGVRNGTAEIGGELLEDVAQTRRELHPFGHREGEPFGLPLLMVGILPDQHHLHRIGRSERKGVEHLPRRGKHLTGTAFLLQLLQNPVELVLVEAFAEKRTPRFRNPVGRHRLSIPPARIMRMSSSESLWRKRISRMVPSALTSVPLISPPAVSCSRMPSNLSESFSLISS